MICYLCELEIKYDSIKCDICEIEICESCDNSTNFMFLDDEIVVRCSGCVLELVPQPCEYQYQQNQRQESCIENVDPCVQCIQELTELTQKPLLLITET